jgi:mRNA interferase RelE/StbE
VTWQIEWDDRARKELRSLDFSIQKKILSYLRERVTDNPQNFGRGLVGDKSGLWRYRVEDYRIVCRLEENRLVVLVLAVGHRKEIYD